jgi:predicted ATPase
METSRPSKKFVPRIEYLRVKNYRALHDLELKNISPLTVFLGPNGSGKSTIFDVFAFLAECFLVGLRKAWDKRNRFKELRTRGSEGDIVFELKYREKPKSPLITYHLAIAEQPKGPYVTEEWLEWRRGQRGKPFKFLNFKQGEGQVTTGDMPDQQDKRIDERLDSPEMLAVNTLGQFAKHPRVSALRRFITGWYLSYLSADATRGIPESGPQERMSATGDNLPNVIQYLKEQHEERLKQILLTLSHRIPRLEKVDAELMADGRLLLQIKDAPFERPILAKFASDGTLKMLAYLTLLYDPEPPQLIGVEEPENYLHPRLLPELAEECREATARTQLMITTHSPFFVNGLRANELWVLYRDAKGYTHAKRAADMRGIPEFIEAGATLGNLWMEGYFEVGDPLTASGGPKRIPYVAK